MRHSRGLFLASLLAAGSAPAGPFPPAAGLPESDAIARTDPSLVLWADRITVQRGPLDLLETFPVVSLGDRGRATLRFPQPIADGPGYDFAVFENSFNDFFLKLAFVEVSSDGIHFARFPSSSVTPTDSQVGSFAGVDPTDLHNLAGKFRAGFGTPFDLADIADPNLNRAAVTHVRIVDVVGSIDPALGSTDASGIFINDPFPTSFPSGGFDLDAVGVRHAAPASYQDWSMFHFGVPSVSPDLDPDRDRLPNHLEWSLWTSPFEPTPGFSIDCEDGSILLSFRTHSSRLPATLRLTGSPDLQTWVPIASVEDGSWLPTAAGVQITVTPDTPDFVSVEVSESPFTFFRIESGP